MQHFADFLATPSILWPYYVQKFGYETRFGIPTLATPSKHFAHPGSTCCTLGTLRLILLSPGPRWLDRRTSKVLQASRRYDRAGKSKTAGDLASTLQLNIWRRVLFIPPPPFYTGRRRDFEADLHSCWYGTVVLLFLMTVKSDSGELWECDCAMIDVLYNLQTPRCT